MTQMQVTKGPFCVLHQSPFQKAHLVPRAPLCTKPAPQMLTLIYPPTVDLTLSKLQSSEDCLPSQHYPSLVWIQFQLALSSSFNLLKHWFTERTDAWRLRYWKTELAVICILITSKALESLEFLCHQIFNHLSFQKGRLETIVDHIIF